MEAYKVPKDAARVLMDVPPDPPQERVLFLSEYSARHRGPETVSDVLSTPDIFVPVAEGGDGFVLLRKGAIRWVKLSDPGRTEWLFDELKQGWPQIFIRLEFPEGDHLEGAIYAMAPEGERRVSDVISRQEGFLPLEVGGSLYLVNLDRVKTIRTMEGSRGGTR